MNLGKLSTILAVLLGSVFAVMLFGPSSLAAQCSLCRTALTNSDEGRRWAQGINSGIILLLLAPFLIFSTIALRIYSRQVKAVLWKVASQCLEVYSRWKAPFTKAAKST